MKMETRRKNVDPPFLLSLFFHIYHHTTIIIHIFKGFKEKILINEFDLYAHVCDYLNFRIKIY